MMEKYVINGIIFMPNTDRGYGAAHYLCAYKDNVLKKGRCAINIGTAKNQYQTSVSADGTEQEVLEFLIASGDVIRNFLLERGGDSPCGLFDLYSFKEFKEAIERVAE